MWRCTYSAPNARSVTSSVHSSVVGRLKGASERRVGGWLSCSSTGGIRDRWRDWESALLELVVAHSSESDQPHRRPPKDFTADARWPPALRSPEGAQSNAQVFDFRPAPRTSPTNQATKKMTATIHRMWMANPTPARMSAMRSRTRIIPMGRTYPGNSPPKRSAGRKVYRTTNNMTGLLLRSFGL
jgi:hypothetical protein